MQPRIFTFGLIKPDAVEAGHTEAVLALIRTGGFNFLRRKPLRITREQAEDLYYAHAGRPYFTPQIDFITSGRSVAFIFAGPENPAAAFRALIGPADPAKRLPSQIRYEYGTDIRRNAVHGSDSEEDARREAAIFFPEEFPSKLDLSHRIIR